MVAPGHALEQTVSREDYGIIGNSEKILALRREIDLVGPTKATVLIYGEDGTGKELIAKAMHRKQYTPGQSSGHFVAINCAGIPDELLESELFGYKRGSFTGAYADRKGKFQHASGGTIFLDEIGEMSLYLQSKLLRVLQERIINPLGSNEGVNVSNVRIVAATNKTLDDEVKNGKFRKDLFYRLNVIPIQAPTLRERKEDIPELAEYFNQIYASEYQRKVSLDDSFIQALSSYDWPGNVRELENIMQRAIIYSNKTGDKEVPVLTEDDVSQFLKKRSNGGSRNDGFDYDNATFNDVLRHILERRAAMYNTDRETSASLGLATGTFSRYMARLRSNTDVKPRDINLADNSDIDSLLANGTLDQIEKYVANLRIESHPNRADAARSLDIGRCRLDTITKK